MSALLLEPRVAGVSEIEDVPIELFEEQGDLSPHKITACFTTCKFMSYTLICDSVSV